MLLEYAFAYRMPNLIAPSRQDVQALLPLAVAAVAVTRPAKPLWTLSGGGDGDVISNL